MRTLLLCAVAGLMLGAPAAAPADVFNGRIAFASVRSDPQGRSFDILSMNPTAPASGGLETSPSRAGLELLYEHGPATAWSPEHDQGAVALAQLSPRRSRHRRGTKRADLSSRIGRHRHPNGALSPDDDMLARLRWLRRPRHARRVSVGCARPRSDELADKAFPHAAIRSSSTPKDRPVAQPSRAVARTTALRGRADLDTSPAYA